MATITEERNGTNSELGHDPIRQIPVADLCPSPENDRLYRPVVDDDPDIVALATSIRENGVMEPLVVTEDGHIVSGHRRYAAAQIAGLEEVPCRVLPIRRLDDLDRFLVLLREYNRQREKSLDERIREQLVSVNPEEAYQSLVAQRKARAAVSAPKMEIVGVKTRAAISNAKTPFLAAIRKILRERKEFWPLSDRQIHYALLNDPPLKHSSKPKSRYANDQPSYKALVDLLTRARVDGSLPMESIADETRPVSVWNVYREASAFVKVELEEFLTGYSRDLLQSQPNHIELLVEKNTVAPILRPVAADYCVPMTSGRGYCSLPPRHQMVTRYRQSGKVKLILLVVSDHDPDGEEIFQSLARSLRDDFGVRDIHPRKVALTAEQVERYGLPTALKAKESSSNFKKFERLYDTSAYELEALEPQVLQTIVRQAIEGALDTALFNAEVEAEKAESVELCGKRKAISEILKGV